MNTDIITVISSPAVASSCHYDAWNDVQQDLVLNLSRQYGDALRGIITDSLMHHMRLFIDVDVAE